MQCLRGFPLGVGVERSGGDLGFSLSFSQNLKKKKEKKEEEELRISADCNPDSVAYKVIIPMLEMVPSTKDLANLLYPD